MLRLPEHIKVKAEKQLDGSTNVLVIGTLAVHRKHTKKDLYLIKRIYTAVHFTDFETVKKSEEIMKKYSEVLLSALQRTAESGEYTEEDKRGDMRKYYYNDWKWYDPKKGEVVDA